MKVLLFISIFTLVYSKEIRLIDNKTGDPIKNVNVYTDKYGTTTDENGYCSLELFDETDEITFSMIGYETITKRYGDITKVLYMKRRSIPMELVTVFAKDKNSKKRYYRLERDVRKVYPYAKKTSELLVEYSSIIDSLEQYSGVIRYYKKRQIFSKIEDELLVKYGHSLKKMKRRQGRILIRLIDRETGRTSYNIIKDFRNVFSAGFWQLTASLFGHDLRSVYNENKGEDIFIEYIINKIERETNKISFRTNDVMFKK
jgi:hypothetical protein